MAITSLKNMEGGRQDYQDSFEESLQYVKSLQINFIAECIGIRLSKSGAGKWCCNCVFHSEKTPSLYFFEKTNSFKWFGCGEGGDGIKLYMKYMNCDFKTALNDLSKF
jgi:DNA primase